MKKLFYLAVAALSMTLMACNGDEPGNNGGNNGESETPKVVKYEFEDCLYMGKDLLKNAEVKVEYSFNGEKATKTLTEADTVLLRNVEIKNFPVQVTFEVKSIVLDENIDFTTQAKWNLAHDYEYRVKGLSADGSLVQYKANKPLLMFNSPNFIADGKKMTYEVFNNQVKNWLSQDEFHKFSVTINKNDKGEFVIE